MRNPCSSFRQSFFINSWCRSRRICKGVKCSFHWIERELKKPSVHQAVLLSFQIETTTKKFWWNLLLSIWFLLVFSHRLIQWKDLFWSIKKSWSVFHLLVLSIVYLVSSWQLCLNIPPLCSHFTPSGLWLLSIPSLIRVMIEKTFTAYIY